MIGARPIETPLEIFAPSKIFAPFPISISYELTSALGLIVDVNSPPNVDILLNSFSRS